MNKTMKENPMDQKIKLDTRQLLGFRLLHANAPSSSLEAKIGMGKGDPILISTLGAKIGLVKPGSE
ncbi:hypothetical protein [Thioalkalivibrio sp. ALMg13-2]|uniref:hypothetical protein n=1 Tax=Thioalkalivibrio sp. ALMg13-2 TaxID=1158167 RepID=UPI00038144EC|nr:hypothetical protein [Thioalkalivibrio sp. ALMg13-2]